MRAGSRLRRLVGRWEGSGAWRRGAAAAIVAATMAGAPGAAWGARGAPPAGEAAPLFTLADLDGNAVSLAAYRGRVVVLHFWATWCTPCRHEMPILDAVSRRHAGEAIVLAINLAEKRERVRAFRQETGLTLPILLDPRGKVAAAYGVLSLPITLVVGPDGRVAGSVEMGTLTEADLEARIAGLHGPPR
jgi:peroxiredoxin